MMRLSSLTSSSSHRAALYIFLFISIGVISLYKSTDHLSIVLELVSFETTTTTNNITKTNITFLPLNTQLSSLNNSAVDQTTIRRNNNNTTSSSSLLLSFNYPSTASVYDDNTSFLFPQTTYYWNNDDAKKIQFPCFHETKPWKHVQTQRSPSHEGLLFTREMKTGSSTLTGVVLHVAMKKGREKEEEGRILSSSSTNSSYSSSFVCKHRIDHSSARQMDYGNRNKLKSFHFSLLRHPISRIISHYFHFEVSAQQQPGINNDNFATWIQSPSILSKLSNYYIRDLSVSKTETPVLMKLSRMPIKMLRQLKHDIQAHQNDVLHHDNNTQHNIIPPPLLLQKTMNNGTYSFLLQSDLVKQVLNDMEFNDDDNETIMTSNRFYHNNNPIIKRFIQNILDEYDFIAITERMDESLIVLRHLLNKKYNDNPLELSDMLYISTKSSGTMTTGGTNTSGPVCFPLQQSYITSSMYSILKSNNNNKFIQTHFGLDILLYHAANKSLDNTIEALIVENDGMDSFNKELKLFRQMLQIAHHICSPQIKYRCDHDGNFIGSKNSTCILWDVGCANSCLQSLNWTELLS